MYTWRSQIKTGKSGAKIQVSSVSFWRCFRFKLTLLNLVVLKPNLDEDIHPPPKIKIRTHFTHKLIWTCENKGLIQVLQMTSSFPHAFIRNQKGWSRTIRVESLALHITALKKVAWFRHLRSPQRNRTWLKLTDRCSRCGKRCSPNNAVHRWEGWTSSIHIQNSSFNIRLSFNGRKKYINM